MSSNNGSNNEQGQTIVEHTQVLIEARESGVLCASHEHNDVCASRGNQRRRRKEQETMVKSERGIRLMSSAK